MGLQSLSARPPPQMRPTFATIGAGGLCTVGRLVLLDIVSIQTTLPAGLLFWCGCLAPTHRYPRDPTPWRSSLLRKVGCVNVPVNGSLPPVFFRGGAPPIFDIQVRFPRVVGIGRQPVCRPCRVLSYAMLASVGRLSAAQASTDVGPECSKPYTVPIMQRHTHKPRPLAPQHMRWYGAGKGLCYHHALV